MHVPTTSPEVITPAVHRRGEQKDQVLVSLFEKRGDDHRYPRKSFRRLPPLVPPLLIRPAWGRIPKHTLLDPLLLDHDPPPWAMSPLSCIIRA